MNQAQSQMDSGLPNNRKKFQSLTNSLKNKLTDWTAIRSASPLLIQSWIRYQKAHEEIDRAFNGVLFDPNLRPDDEKSKGRFMAWLNMHKEVARQEEKLWDRWFLIHGSDPTNVNEAAKIQINNNAQINQAQINNELPKFELESVRLARYLHTHASVFDLPLPEKMQNNSNHWLIL